MKVFPIRLQTKASADFSAEYPQPLDPTEMVSAGGGLDGAQFRPRGLEGGQDDRWFHDEMEGELDAAWHRAMLALMAKRRLEKAITAATASEAQLEAGNYKKKHLRFQGMDVSIENRAGSVREGKNKDGTPWRVKMHYDYGYIRRTEGTDGDHVDVYIGPDESADTVYVVHQAEPETGRYDEDKVMLGFGGEEQAKAAYLKQYDSPKFFGAMTAVPLSMFKEKVFGARGELVVPDAAKKVSERRLKSLVLMHLPGKHSQKLHGRGGTGQGKIERAPKKLEGPGLEQRRKEAKARIQEWLASGMNKKDILWSGYKWRAWANDRGGDWDWAVWEEIQGLAQQEKFDYKDFLTDEDILSNPEAPAELLEYTILGQKWRSAENIGDQIQTGWRNHPNITEMEKFLETETGQNWRIGTLRQLWGNVIKNKGEAVKLTSPGLGATRHFEEFNPYFGMKKLLQAKNWQEALDTEVTVYRGIEEPDYPLARSGRPFLSFTTSPDIALLFAEGYFSNTNRLGAGAVIPMNVRFGDLLGFINMDGEFEVLVPRKYFKSWFAAALKSLIAKADSNGQANVGGAEPAGGATLDAGAALGALIARYTAGDAGEVSKAGTVEGARKAWLLRRKRQLIDQMRAALQNRDAKAMRRARLEMAGLQRLAGAVAQAKHLAGQHDQKRHGRSATPMGAVAGLEEWIKERGRYDQPEVRKTAENLLKTYDNMVLYRAEKQYGSSMFGIEFRSPLTETVEERRGEFPEDTKFVDTEIENNPAYSETMPPEFDALKSDPEISFRGMQHEEMSSILDSGELQTEGGYNFTFQGKETYFSDRPEVAASYAGGFAPVQHLPTFGRPGYVVAVRRLPGQKWSFDERTSEWAAQEPLSAKQVVRVMEVRLLWQSPGYVEIRDTGGTGNRISPSQRVVYRDVTEDFLRALSGEQKHLPGQHEQQAHAGEMYHGTTSAAAKAILKMGLLVSKTRKDRTPGKKGIYATNALNSAVEYGQNRAVLAGKDTFGVIVFNGGEPADFSEDWGFARFDRDIPPSKIVRIEIRRTKDRILISTLKSVAVENEFYVPALFDGEDYELIDVNGEVEKHLPGQHDQTTHAGDRGAGEAVTGEQAAGQAQEQSEFARAVKGAADPQAAWKALSSEDKDRLADAANSIHNRFQRESAEFGEADLAGSLDDVVNKRLAQVGDRVMPDAHTLIAGHMQAMGQALAEAGVPEAQAKALLVRSTDALAIQERESMGRQLGDHGARHLLGDAAMALEILRGHPGADPPQQTAAIYLAAVFHDTGYTTEPGGIIGMDGRHPAWGKQYYDAQVGPAIAEALGQDWAAQVGRMVETHADTNLDWKNDPMASALRVADNVALFHAEKLPALYKYAPQNLKVLMDLGAKKIDIATARQQMAKNIAAARVPDAVRQQLLRASQEVGQFSPKFTLGMLGGSVKRLQWQGNYLNVFVNRNRTAVRLQQHLDLGQRQFLKFAEAYLGEEAAKAQLGAKGFVFGQPPKLKFTISGEVIKAMLVQMHLAGKHDQQRHAGYRRAVRVPTNESYREQVEQMQDFVLKQFESRTGKSSAEVHSEVEQKIKALLQGTKVAIQVKASVLEKVLESGSFDNQFQMRGSGGFVGLAGRAELEERLFGISEDADPQVRPIYGFLVEDPQNPMIQTAVEQYGDATVILKEEVGDRTTFVLGDSMDHNFAGFIPNTAPAPLRQPRSTAWLAAGFLDLLEGEIKSVDEVGVARFSLFMDRPVRYLEAQVHGDVRVLDIAEVHFKTPPPARLSARLRSIGIRVFVSGKVIKTLAAELRLRAALAKHLPGEHSQAAHAGRKRQSNQVLKLEIDRWENTSRKDIALDAASSPGEKVVIRKAGELLGIASLVNSDLPEELQGDFVRVGSFATKHKGNARELFSRVVARARKQGKGIWLHAPKVSAMFEKFGMRRLSSNSTILYLPFREEKAFRRTPQDVAISPAQAAILQEITERPTPPDAWWMQWREEVVKLEHMGLVVPLDWAHPQVSTAGGGTVRTLHLTEKGRGLLLAWRKQTAGNLKSLVEQHLPGKHDQQAHGRASAARVVGLSLEKARKALAKLGYKEHPAPLDEDTPEEKNLQATLRRSKVNVSNVQPLNGKFGDWILHDTGGTPAGMGYGRYVIAANLKRDKQYFALIQGSMRTGGMGAALVDILLEREGLEGGEG